MQTMEKKPFSFESAQKRKREIGMEKGVFNRIMIARVSRWLLDIPQYIFTRWNVASVYRK